MELPFFFCFGCFCCCFGGVVVCRGHLETADVDLSVLRRFLNPSSNRTKMADGAKASKVAKRVIACLDVRENDKGGLVVTKGDQYDVRENTKEKEVRNLGKLVDLAGQYYKYGADEISFLNIIGFWDFPLGDLPMLQVCQSRQDCDIHRKMVLYPEQHYSSLEVASEYFRSGSDKISIGSDAVYAAEDYQRTGNFEETCMQFSSILKRVEVLKIDIATS
ncbi:hypothetical protein K1719_033678 [Acacia pycnantha]|nr:hypothetical protein K1719_033678 [Acacia pycnantha]